MARVCRRVAKGLRHRYVAGYCMSCRRKKPSPSRLAVPRAALDSLIVQVKDREGLPSNTNFSYVMEDGREEVVMGNTCFGSLLHAPNDHAPFKWFIFYRKQIEDRGAHDQEINKKATDAYLNWLCTDSHWADCFEAGPKTLREKGAIFDATKWSALWIIMSCQLVRIAHEYPKIISTWYKFQKHIDPHASLLFAHAAGACYNAKITEEHYVMADNWGAQHTPFHADTGGKKALKRLLAGEFNYPKDPQPEQPVMSDNLDFRGMHQLFQKKAERNFLLKFPNPVTVRVAHEYYHNRQVNENAHVWVNLKRDLRKFMEVNT